MQGLVIAGSLLTVTGLGLLGYCIAVVLRARRAGLPDAELRARLQRIVAVNMAALLLSALGLVAVVVGVILPS